MDPRYPWVWDPRLIVLQMICVQLFFYVSFSVSLAFVSLFTGSLLSIELVCFTLYVAQFSV